MASTLRILVPAAKASPSPPVGPALGQKGVKAMDFCKQFNAKTAKYTPGIPIPTFVTINKDRTFTFTVKNTPKSYLLKQACNAEKGSADAKNVKIGTLSTKHIYEIAKIKQEDQPHLNLHQIAKSVLGSCTSIGIEVKI